MPCSLGGARETPPQVCFYDCFLNISPSQPRWKDLQSLQYHHGRRHLGPPARHGTDGPSGWHCASNPHRRFVLRHSPPAALRKVCHDCWTALFDGPLSQHKIHTHTIIANMQKNCKGLTCVPKTCYMEESQNGKRVLAGAHV